jgi:hypothetical protein
MIQTNAPALETLQGRHQRRSGSTSRREKDNGSRAASGPFVCPFRFQSPTATSIYICPRRRRQFLMQQIAARTVTACLYVRVLPRSISFGKLAFSVLLSSEHILQVWIHWIACVPNSKHTRSTPAITTIIANGSTLCMPRPRPSDWLLPDFTSRTARYRRTFDKLLIDDASLANLSHASC